MKVKIYIPTMGRLDKQKTFNALPPRLQRLTWLVCPKEEVEEHRTRGRQQVLTCPYKGIVRTRQWVLDTTDAEVMFMLDDDLKFMKRMDPDPKLSYDMQPEDFERLFLRCAKLALQYPLVGLMRRADAKFNRGQIPATEIHCARMACFYCYHVPTLKEIGAGFFKPGIPKDFTMDDFFMALQVLTSGHANAVVTNFAYDQTSNSKGGASLYRSLETQERSAKVLAQWFPDFVRLVKKTTKGGWFGGERTDVAVSWKKAYESAEKKTLV